MPASDPIFGVDSLSEAITTFAAEPDADRITGLFMAGRQLTCEGDSVSWDEIEMHRHLAPISGGDSPSVHQGQATRRVRSSTLAHIKVSKTIPGGKLFRERGPGSIRADAEQVLAYELKDLQKMIGSTVEYLATSALLGTITVSNTTIPGTTVAFTVSFSPNTYTRSAAWSTVGTKIASAEIPALMKDHRAASGMIPRIAITEPDVSGYILANTEAQTLLKNSLGAAWLQRSAFDDRFGPGLQVGGLDFRTTDGVYVPEGGSATRYFTADRVITLPAESELGGVLGMALGTGVVPAGPAAGAAGASGLRLAPSAGYYAYSVFNTDPAGIKLVAGWCGLPLLLFPSGVTVATVV
jgi:hypothetical protein